jgi:hypothetical protein
MSPAPVVLLFHGYSLNAAFMSAYAKFPALADAHGFIGLIPGGSRSPQFWKSAALADGPDCPRASAAAMRGRAAPSQSISSVLRRRRSMRRRSSGSSSKRTLGGPSVSRVRPFSLRRVLFHGARWGSRSAGL